LARSWRKGNPCAVLVEMYINGGTLKNDIDVLRNNCHIIQQFHFWVLSKENENTNSKKIYTLPCSLQHYLGLPRYETT